jgi:hypothetical protein
VADVTVLVCACGMRLKAAGAVPGRVGKCPACGGMLRVPDATPTLPGPATDEIIRDDDGPSGYATTPECPTSFSPRRTRQIPAPRPDLRPLNVRNGLVRPPDRPETRLHQSLLYPAWGDTSLALLVFLPPVLVIASIPPVTVFQAWISGSFGAGLIGVVMLLPALLVLVPVLGFTLVYLGRVLATSATGDVHPPRWPDWDLSDAIRGLARWCWALVVAGFVGGCPAVAYWIYCGDVDLMDALILLELASVGTVYANVALLASILHDDLLGANPVTVFQAIRRVGLGWLSPTLCLAAFALVALVGLFEVVAIRNPTLAVVAFWAYWVFVLYGMMVVLRVLGLCYHRHARVLGWFRERPRWGV